MNVWTSHLVGIFSAICFFLPSYGALHEEDDFYAGRRPLTLSKVEEKLYEISCTLPDGLDPAKKEAITWALETTHHFLEAHYDHEKLWDRLNKLNHARQYYEATIPLIEGKTNVLKRVLEQPLTRLYMSAVSGVMKNCEMGSIHRILDLVQDSLHLPPSETCHDHLIAYQEWPIPHGLKYLDNHMQEIHLGQRLSPRKPAAKKFNDIQECLQSQNFPYNQNAPFQAFQIALAEEVPSLKVPRILQAMGLPQRPDWEQEHSRWALMVKDRLLPFSRENITNQDMNFFAAWAYRTQEETVSLKESSHAHTLQLGDHGKALDRHLRLFEKTRTAHSLATAPFTDLEALIEKHKGEPCIPPHLLVSALSPHCMEPLDMASEPLKRGK